MLNSCTFASQAMAIPIPPTDNFRMNTGYGRYGAAYNMVGFKLL
jgi:hypothetical protein